MASSGGRGLLGDLAAQIDNLGSYIGDVTVALFVVALRIRHVTRALPA